MSHIDMFAARFRFTELLVSIAITSETYLLFLCKRLI